MAAGADVPAGVYVRLVMMKAHRTPARHAPRYWTRTRARVDQAEPSRVS